MNDLATERTPPVIAAEINMITHQTKRILLASAVEIGRRLKEAKSLIKHGEWGKWLEESVSYSQSTASRLIKLYEEYGASFPDGSGMSNFAPVPNLTYTQALLLLSLSGEEREEFLAQNDVAGMTKQELQQALKDRDQAKEEKEQAEQENEVLKRGLELIGSTLAELKKEQAKAPVPPDHPENVQKEDSVVAAASPTNNTPLPTHNLPTEIDPNAAAKYVERCDTCCKTISTTFFELTTALTNLTHLDGKLKEEKRKEAQKLLETIAETIKEWPPAKKPLKVIR
ncbi:MAG TPA: DUF3102 domain-containing protein [Desulfitobacterium dehalogenans]|uniref:DUF3102 domain-containing protein n=1 Tax=Desulfitobacterium dehalogenans TaxID=36854 RepID=A0A7C6Z6K9_9FIRM|nr:DUF3102 domain-containing protein [Desulfitobacterium dehalogenans]